MYTFNHINFQGKPVYFQHDAKKDLLFCPFSFIKTANADAIQASLRDIPRISFSESGILIENASDYMKTNIPKISDMVTGVTTTYNPLLFKKKTSKAHLSAQSAPDLSPPIPLVQTITHSGSSPRLHHGTNLTLDSLIPEVDQKLGDLYRKTAVYKSAIFAQVQQNSTERHTQKAVVTSAILIAGYTIKFNEQYHAIKHRQAMMLSRILDEFLNPIFLDLFPESSPSNALCDYFRRGIAFVMDNELHHHNNKPTYTERKLGIQDSTYTLEMKAYRETIELEARANFMLQHWMFLINDDALLAAAIASATTTETLATLKLIKFAINYDVTLRQKIETTIRELRALIIESGKTFRQNKIAFTKIEEQYKNQKPIRSAASTSTEFFLFVSFKGMMVKLLGEFGLTPENHDAIFLMIKNMLLKLHADTTINAKPLIEKLHDSDKDFYLSDEWGMGFMQQWQLNLEPLRQPTKSLRKKESSQDLFGTHFTEQFRLFVLTKIAACTVAPKPTGLSKSMGV